ncbi:MAG: ATP-grasp domain-containing protein [Desulfuromonadales bacterium]|nr:ATP-grasp domain-containing protein [Desulfuromonadales bacterium]
MKRRTVLVTGVGAIIGYGIIRSLKRLPSPPQIIGMDIFADAVGGSWCDHFVRAVAANDPGYVDFIRQTVLEHEIDLILPGIEQDAWSLSVARQELAASGVALALNCAELITLAHDKWHMHQALQQAGFPTIKTRIDGSFDQLSSELGAPFLLKPRRSYASKGIYPLHCEEDLHYWRRKLGDGFMVQQIVGSDEEEYTIGVFGYGDGTSSNQIALRRTLSGEGATAKAWSVECPQLTAVVDAMVKHFRPIGPTNFQFRKHEGEYLLLEVNPRISSSTSLRAALGFNEAAMCLDFYLDNKRAEPAKLRKGCALRFVEDVVCYDSDSC